MKMHLKGFVLFFLFASSVFLYGSNERWLTPEDKEKARVYEVEIKGKYAKASSFVGFLYGGNPRHSNLFEVIETRLETEACNAFINHLDNGSLRDEKIAERRALREQLELEEQTFALEVQKKKEIYTKKRLELEASIADHESFLSPEFKMKTAEQKFDTLFSNEVQGFTLLAVKDSLELMNETVAKEAEDFKKNIEEDQREREQKMRKMIMNSRCIVPK